MADNSNNIDDQKGNSELSDMSFDENSTNAKSNWFAKDNPFEKTDNPFVDKSGTAQKPENYTFSNENIESNKSQSKSLAAVLLALLLSIGLLVAALWGLSHKKQKAQLDPSTNIGSSAQAPQAQPSLSTQPELPQDTQAPKQALSPAPNDSCKILEAQRYIATSIGDLDRVTNKLEDRADDLLEGPDAKNSKKLAFLKGKTEELSRAEAEIRNFSEAHLEKDLGVTFKSEEAPCKIKDGPKYLNAWLDGIKERINDLSSDLNNPEGAGQTIAALPEASTNNEPVNKPSQEIKEQKKNEKQNAVITAQKDQKARNQKVKNSFPSDVKFSAQKPLNAFRVQTETVANSSKPQSKRPAILSFIKSKPRSPQIGLVDGSKQNKAALLPAVRPQSTEVHPNHQIAEEPKPKIVADEPEQPKPVPPKAYQQQPVQTKVQPPQRRSIERCEEIYEEDYYPSCNEEYYYEEYEYRPQLAPPPVARCRPY
jgi:hypothetical protein